MIPLSLMGFLYGQMTVFFRQKAALCLQACVSFQVSVLAPGKERTLNIIKIMQACSYISNV